MAFSPDGKFLATGGQDKLVRIWDIISNTELVRLEGHSQLVEAVEFSPDGKWLVSVSGNYRMPERSGEVRIWDIDATSTHPHWAFEPETGPISGLSFAPDGKRFATSGGDGAVHIWGLDPADAVKSQGPDSHWPVAKVQVSSKLHGQPGVMSLAVTPDGSLLAAGTYQKIKLFQLPSGTDRGELPGHDSWVMKLAFSRDGKRLASSASDGTNIVWDISIAAKELGVLERPYVTTWPIAFTPDGSSLLVTWRDNFIYSWDFMSAGRSLYHHEYRAGGIEFSPDGDLLAIFGEASPEGVIRVLKGNSVVQSFSAAGGEPASVADVTAVRFAPDGKTLYAAQQNRFKGVARGGVEAVYGSGQNFVESCEIVSWDIATKKATRYHLSIRGPVQDIAVSTDGKNLILVGGRPGLDEGEAFLWHPGDRDVTASLGGHHGLVRAALFVDHGRHAVTACDDGSLRFWKMPVANLPTSPSP
jgi:WD40 repeat protein